MLRYLDDWLVQAVSREECLRVREVVLSLSPARDTNQLRKIQSHSLSNSHLSGDPPQCPDFEGFSSSEADRQASIADNNNNNNNNNNNFISRDTAGIATPNKKKRYNETKKQPKVKDKEFHKHYT